MDRSKRVQIKMPRLQKQDAGKSQHVIQKVIPNIRTVLDPLIRKIRHRPNPLPIHPIPFLKVSAPYKKALIKCIQETCPR